jgi:IclR family acetate operon transcriptional repressor
MKNESLHEPQNGDQYNIRVLERAFRVLAVLSDGERRPLQVLSREVGLSTSTTFRLLSTLVRHRYVERDDQTNRYSLGLACLELARSSYLGNEVRRAALPELDKLRNETRETVHLAVLDEMEVVYIEKLEGLQPIGLMGSRVGGHSPAYCTGVGKALLAHLSPEVIKQRFGGRKLKPYTENTITSVEGLLAELTSIRGRGYALDHGEHEAGVCCVAAPVFDMRGDAIAALSVSGPAERLEPIERNRAMIQSATAAAQNISARMGYSSH